MALRSNLWLAILTLTITIADARLSTPQSNDSVFVSPTCVPTHQIGKIKVKAYDIAVGVGSDFDDHDCLTGKLAFPSGAEYPKSSNLSYLGSGFFMIGGVVNGDTAISEANTGEFVYLVVHEYRSTLNPLLPFYQGAVSEQDYLSTAIDNDPDPPYEALPDYFNNRRHIPLGIKISNFSHAWSYEYAEDFILCNYIIQNVGNWPIDKLYFGITMQPQVGYYPSSDASEPIYADDVGGFIESHRVDINCGYIDTLNLVWGADNDGDPINGAFSRNLVVTDKPRKSAPDVTGFFFLDYPVDPLIPPRFSYNWWVSGTGAQDFGPRHRKDFRDFRTGGIGTPLGDVNKYYQMRNGEIDYDPIYTASIQTTDLVWGYPPQEYAEDFSDGQGGPPFMVGSRVVS